MTTNNELNDAFFTKIDNIINILKATGELFISMHLFDLQEMKLVPIKTNERIASLSKDYTNAQDIVTNVMQNLSVDFTLPVITRFTDPSTLEERMKDKRTISQLFEGKYLGWCNTIFIKVTDEEPLRYVLCVVQNVDDYIKRIEQMNKKTVENIKLKAMVDALMNEYTTICSMNLKSKQLEFLRKSKPVEEALKKEVISSCYEDLMRFYLSYNIKEAYKKEALEFFSLEHLNSIEVGTSKSFVYRNETGDYGEAKTIRTSNSQLLIGFNNKSKDIEDRNELLYTDSLTGVKNRAYYDQEVHDMACNCLVIIDVDYFKTINDTYGHQLGDEVLIQIAHALKRCIRKTDDIIRYGGDEFLIAFEDIPTKAVREVLKEMQKSIKNIKIEEHPEIKLSISIGAAFGKGIVSDMFSTADGALYKSKEIKDAKTIDKYEKQELKFTKDN